VPFDPPPRRSAMKQRTAQCGCQYQGADHVALVVVAFRFRHLSMRRLIKFTEAQEEPFSSTYSHPNPWHSTTGPEICCTIM
jgi:hypothetical protein